MRKVAPDKPGNAVSQNNWLVLYLKPMFGKFTTTTLHTIHTANASSSAGIEIHKLRLAVDLPLLCQKLDSSGSQLVIKYLLNLFPCFFPVTAD